MLKLSAASKFPSELKVIKYEIETLAREYGLDFFKVIFEVLDYRELNEVAAYGGFPHRYPHWRFGMEYEQLQKSYAYGLSKIYEMVINNDPCYAYLLRCNNLVDQKLVMAHVYGHCDFFKNNLYFDHTNRRMVDEMANHATRINRYVERYGREKVENFIDCCLSLDNLIDPHEPFMKRRNGERKDPAEALIRAGESECECPREGGEEKTCGGGTCQDHGHNHDLFGDDEDEERVAPRRLKSKGYMDAYINPPEFLKARAEEIKARLREKKRFPERPEADVLLFLLENAPLKNWQRDVLSIVREEAYYYLPQAQTKVMNEGWAVYWHSMMMTQRVLKDNEIIDYADHHSGTLGGSRLSLNPYKLGVELFRDIEERWDKGRFGKEWEECEDLAARRTWDRQVGLGRQKIFEVRRLYNDLTFLDTFLTEDFCRRHRLFTYAHDDKKKAWVIQSREFAEVKEALLVQLTNLGRPRIVAQDGNFENRGELLLVNRDENRELKWDFAEDTLVNLHHLWKRPVHVETAKGGKKVRLSFDGKEHKVKDLG
ncbi:MAG: SpoVR family protein [Thermodesulfobacteriota bacterium]